MTNKILKPGSFLRSCIEVSLLALALQLLIFYVIASPGSIDLNNGAISISVVVGVYFVLRLQMPKGIWYKKLFLEIVYAGTLCAINALLIPLLLALGELIFTGQTNTFTANTQFWLTMTGFGFFCLRVVRALWHWWDALQKRRLLWSMVHVQLTTVALIMLAVSLVGVVYILATMPPSELAEKSLIGNEIIYRFVGTILPYLVIIVGTISLTLMVVLPPAALVSFFSSQRMVKRLKNLTETARAIRSGDYAARTDVTGCDEVAELQQNFNSTADQLQSTLLALRMERDKVSALNEARRNLLVNVSHELRTPLATLQSRLDAMLEEDSQPTPADLTVLQQEIKHLSHLVDDLFDLSRAEVKALDLQIKRVEAGRILRMMAKTFAPLAWQQSKVEVAVQASPGEYWVMADEERLEQVLANLLRNALRFTPPGGIVSLNATHQDQQICLEVRDTGEGITPDEAEHIWQRFYRGKQAKNNPGAGLGLALVKELTEAMGGSISMQSVPGEGSVFMLCLPEA